jgi:hypothetical protein
VPGHADLAGELRPGHAGGHQGGEVQEGLKQGGLIRVLSINQSTEQLVLAPEVRMLVGICPDGSETRIRWMDRAGVPSLCPLGEN